MSWYIWGVTSFDVPLLLDQSLICMKFSRYILTVLSVIRKLKTFWTLWPLVNPAFILTVLPSVMGGTHSVPLCSNDLCGWGFASDFRIHHFLFLIRQPPALPCRLQHSTIGRSGLNHRVRDGNGCVPWAHRHRKHWALSEVLSSLVLSLFSALGEVLSNLVRRTSLYLITQQ